MSEISPQQALLQMTTGYWLTQSIYVAAKLGIADLLKEHPKTAAELAIATNTHTDSLYRLLRALASLGIFAETEPGWFSLTPIAECLQTDVPHSLRHWAILCGQHNYQAWGHLLHSVQTGQPGFNHQFGIDLWTYFSQNPDASATFDAAMLNLSRDLSQAIISAYDFSGFSKLVDVGGGRGGLLFPILQAYPHLQGILFDQPAVIEGVQQNPTPMAAGFSDRLSLIGGNFFESVPTGGDAYLLKHIIHDWGDADCAKILTNCRTVMADKSRLLLVEAVIAPGNEPSLGKLLDLEMLAIVAGGRERTQAEYQALLASTNFELVRIVPTQSAVSILEAVPN
ncbi:MAG: methyltransferase [Actinomycetota bacterium]